MQTTFNGKTYGTIYYVSQPDDYIAICNSEEEIKKRCGLTAEEVQAVVYGDKNVRGYSLFNLLIAETN